MGNNRILSRGLGQICCSCMAPPSLRKWDVSLNSGSEDAQTIGLVCHAVSVLSASKEYMKSVERISCGNETQACCFKNQSLKNPKIPCRNRNTGCFWGSIPLVALAYKVLIIIRDLQESVMTHCGMMLTFTSGTKRCQIPSPGVFHLKRTEWFHVLSFN